MHDLPVAIIGAGPVGLATAAHLAEEGVPTVVLEAADRVGASVAQWGHVRLFSPWRYNIDAAAARLLVDEGWSPPDLDELPTGQELITRYLQPLAETRALASDVLLNSRVTAVARTVDRVNHDREYQPYVVRYVDGGREHEVRASSVIDASGTWLSPNPLGANGLPARGEGQQRARVSSGIPDILGDERDAYAGKATAVVGSGHSAANSVLALVALRRRNPATEVHWVVRSRSLRAFGGGELDELAARGRLGTEARRAIDAGEVLLHTEFPVEEVGEEAGRISLHSGRRVITGLDRVIAATGQRPDHALASELRLDLDSALESTRALGPLIDPNVHSCGSVRPHSFLHLRHKDEGFFTLGAKSYGRAPTFLLATGYEQARSVAAHLAGDDERAARVSLVLPETGVCSSDGNTGASCCGGGSGATSPEPAPVGTAASCCG